ncbi:MAG: hypothetical protein ORN85_05200 [Sediminibacterium sp.]|nr:hypothetical protein [Sediminibacterium sp.]
MVKHLSPIYQKFYFFGILILIVCCLTLNQSCSSKDSINPENKINSIILLQYDSAGINLIGQYKAIKYSTNSIPVTLDTIKLVANKTYLFKALLLYTDSVTKTSTDYTNQIWNLRDQHNLIFFPTTTVANLNVTYLDKDSKDFPVGLTTRWKATIPSSILILTDLRHLPIAKTAIPSVNQDLEQSDFNVKFPTIIR